MNKELLTFKLNDHAKIMITLPKPYFFLTNYDESQIFFGYNNEKILLSDFTIYSFIGNLNCLLKKALQNKLQLHPSLTQDLGYMLNRWFKEKKFKFVSITKNGDTYWVADDYQLACGKYASWIYNDVDGNIIFEITPVYPGVFMHEKKQLYREYMQWRTTYKPYFITTISKKIAQQWIDQSQQILKEIEKNMNKMHDEGTI